MKKIFVYLLFVALPCVCGAQDSSFRFVTFIASPWGVSNSIWAEQGPSNIQTLRFVSGTPDLKGTITVDKKANLQEVTLQKDATLKDEESAEGMGWDLKRSSNANGKMHARTGGTIKVKEVSSDENDTLHFDKSQSDTSLLGVSNNLTLQQGITKAESLYTQKVQVRSDTWFEQQTNEPTGTMKWKQCTKNGSNISCGTGGGVTIVSDEIETGDYILMSE